MRWDFSTRFTLRITPHSAHVAGGAALKMGESGIGACAAAMAGSRAMARAARRGRFKAAPGVLMAQF
jgi:hypothetical protein